MSPTAVYKMLQCTVTVNTSKFTFSHHLWVLGYHQNHFYLPRIRGNSVMEKQHQMAPVNARDSPLCSCSIYLLCSVNNDWCLAARCEENQLSSSVMKSDINRFGLKGFLFQWLRASQDALRILILINLLSICKPAAKQTHQFHISFHLA